MHINLELDITSRILRKWEREALETKKEIEIIDGENLELKQNLSKESERARVDAQSWKTKLENLEQQLTQSESISQSLSLGMNFRFKMNLYLQLSDHNVQR